MALKAAETDATKRALATFGNPFGLALYDKEQAGVAKPHNGKGSDQPTTSAGYALTIPGGTTTTYSGSSQFIAAALAEIPKVATLDALYAFWEANVASLTQLRRDAVSESEDPVSGIIAALKDRAQQFGKGEEIDDQQARRVEHHPGTHFEAARLAFPKERRVRDKAHLAFVAKHPCVVCGRNPVHAHHLRFAQPRAMAMKVSDEFTVPLCAIHHDELHRTGDERAWWARHGIIEPLKLAAKLWGASQRGSPAPIPLEAPELPTTQSASPEANTAAE
ncbi:MAG: DUF968 domain-containing protein [Hyphomicrobiaceae bacterium]|nr:DUF968 domain-containing protein [Hyphomicrobiaceae bacterium]